MTFPQKTVLLKKVLTLVNDELYVLVKKTEGQTSLSFLPERSNRVREVTLGLGCYYTMNTSIKPMGIALMICDQVIIDARTNKKSLIGIFNNIAARQFPCRLSRLCIFVSITDGRGKAKTEVRCINEEQPDQVLFGAEGEVSFANPNHVVEAVFEFNNVAFPSPGLHCIQVLSNDEPVLQRRFAVNQLLKEGRK